MNRITLATTGFVQVVCVAANTVAIAKGHAWAVLIFAFLISYIWSHNVRKVAFGDELDRIAYSIGACLGSVSGMWAANMVLG